MDLSRFQQQINEAAGSGPPSLPPVEKWDPQFCGNLNMQIDLDGRWFYEGTPVGRASLVKLFASVLKKEGDKYFLVTPVEKVGLQVEDVPFVFVNWHRSNGVITLTTQCGDAIELNNTNKVELRLPPKPLQDPQATAIPYINVRRNLWGRLHHNVYYQLIEEATQQTGDNGAVSLFVNSGDTRILIGQINAQ